MAFSFKGTSTVGGIEIENSKLVAAALVLCFCYLLFSSKTENKVEKNKATIKKHAKTVETVLPPVPEKKTTKEHHRKKVQPVDVEKPIKKIDEASLEDVVEPVVKQDKKKKKSKNDLSKQLAEEMKILKNKINALPQSATPAISSSDSDSSSAPAIKKSQPHSLPTTTIHDDFYADEWETVQHKKKYVKKEAATDNHYTENVSSAQKKSEVDAPKTPVVMESEIVEKVAPVAAVINASLVNASMTTENVSVSCEQSITIPANKIGVVIGPKGSTWHYIQDTYEVVLNKEESTNGQTAVIVVSGAKADSVSKVTKGIKDLTTKGYSAITATMNMPSTATADHSEVFMERSMQVPSKCVADIVGKNGATIRALQEVTNAKVLITNNTNVVNDVSQSRVTIAGLKSQVNEAKSIIKEILEFHHSNRLNDELIHMEIDDKEVPYEMYSILIGTKGSEIKHIQGNFKVSLHIPNETSINKHIILVGEESNVQAAYKYILKLVQQVNDRKAQNGVKGYEPAGDLESVEEEEEVLEPWMKQYIKNADNSTNEDETYSKSTGGIDFSTIVAQSLNKNKK